MKITSPVPGFSGTGPQGLKFTDGVAHTDDEGIVRYFRRRGYGIDNQAPTVAPTLASPVQPDSRDIPAKENTAPLRDAAVDPAAVDFLPPTNAGKEDPHGPKVVAPGVHAGASSPLVPGYVGADQEQRETAAAQDVLVDGQPHDMSEPINPDDAQPPAAAAAPVVSVEKPPRGAKVAEWRDYATHVAPDKAEEIGGLTKAQLIATYGDDTAPAKS